MRPTPAVVCARLRDPRIHLGAGQLAALAGLRALRHLDLQFFRVDQVVTGDAEAARRHLLDGRVLRVAVLHRHVAIRIFATLARVALAADAVHGDGQRLVRFLGDGAVAHGAGLEARMRLSTGFDLVDRDRLALLEIEQAAQRRQILRAIVDELGVALVRGVRAGAHRLLQAVDAFRVEQVELAIRAPLVLAARGQLGLELRLALGERRGVAHEHFARDHVEADAADARGGAGEVFVDDVLAQAHGFEHLRAVITLHGGDAHLGHHLHHALDRGLREVLAGELVLDARQHLVADHAVESFEGQVRIDDRAAVADQQREVMHLARVAGLQRQRHLHAQALADQVVMQAGDGQQRRDRRVFLVHAAIGEDEDVDLVLVDQPRALRRESARWRRPGRPRRARRGTGCAACRP